MQVRSVRTRVSTRPNPAQATGHDECIVPPSTLSAGDVKDRVDVLRLEPSKEAAGIASRERFDRDPAPSPFLVDLRRDRQRAIGTRSNDEPLPAPGNVLGDRQRGVPEPIPQRLGWAFATPANASALDHHVARVPLAADLDLSERNQLRLHVRIVPPSTIPHGERGAASPAAVTARTP